jgi:hypothetical protein
MSYWVLQGVKFYCHRCFDLHSVTSGHHPFCFHKTGSETDLSSFSATVNCTERCYGYIFIAQLTCNTEAVFSLHSSVKFVFIIFKMIDN